MGQSVYNLKKTLCDFLWDLLVVGHRVGQKCQQAGPLATYGAQLKSKGMLFWRRDFASVFTENERLWIHSELRKISFVQERPPEKSQIGTDGPDDTVLHPEQIQDCCLR